MSSRASVDSSSGFTTTMLVPDPFSGFEPPGTAPAPVAGVFGPSGDFKIHIPSWRVTWFTFSTNLLKMATITSLFGSGFFFSAIRLISEISVGVIPQLRKKFSAFSESAIFNSNPRLRLLAIWMEAVGAYGLSTTLLHF